MLRVNPFQDVIAFHHKFDLAYHGPPRSLDPEVTEYRDKCAVEEIGEMTDLNAKPVDKFDAIIDLIYFLLGTCYLHGWDFNEGWRRVHAANMKKRRALPDGSDSKRGSPLDVVKPEGWTHPDLSDLVHPAPSNTFDWDTLKERAEAVALRIMLADQVPMQFSSLGSCLRLTVRPLLKKFADGERSREMIADLRDIEKMFPEVAP